MTFKATLKAMYADVPVKLCGATAKQLYYQGHEYTRISSVAKGRDIKGNNYDACTVVKEINGRCNTCIHVDVKDVEVADSVPEEIRREIYSE